MDSLEATYEAIHCSVVGRVVEAAVVSVSGKDALSYLQGQCTQDLASLEPGGSVDSLLLSPQGKLEAYVRVLVEGPEAALVLVELDYGEAVLERLRRFKLRVKAELELERVELVELRGPTAAGIAARLGTSVRVVPFSWPGYVGVDLLGLGTLPEGVEPGDPGAFEAARIEAGQPLMAAELSERTIPPEAGIVGRTVSFTKGCFTGQELVARLDARGNRVPRNLRGVVLHRDAKARRGDHLLRGEAAVGELTSVAYSPGLDALVALGYVRREVDMPARLECIPAPDSTAPSTSAPTAAEVRELPILPA